MKYGLSEEQLAEICSIIGSYPQIEEAIIYGSRADDSYKEASDVDIAIKGEKVDESLASKLKFHLEEETYLPFFFDVIAYDAIPSSELKKQIKTKGKTIYRKGWREVKLGSVAEINNGKSNSQDADPTGIYPLFDRSMFTKKSNRYLFNKEAVIVPGEGKEFTPKYYYGKFDLHQIDLHQRCYAIHSFNKSIFPKFCYYYLLNSNDYFRSVAVDSTVLFLRLGHFQKLPVTLPPLPEQEAIAEVLSSLDDKIDLLHRQNKTLENMAQILFPKWFIEDTDEVWEEKKLVEIIDINPKYSLRKGTSAPYLAMSNMNVNSHTPLNWYNRPFKSGMQFQNGDTLFARITPCLEKGKTCFVDFLKENETGWGSTEYIVMRSKPDLPLFLSYMIAKNNTFRNYAISTMIGTSGRQKAQAKDLEEYPIDIPPPTILEKFSKQCDDISLRLKNNTLQLRVLNATRDTLLPKLMNGQVRVGGF